MKEFKKIQYFKKIIDYAKNKVFYISPSLIVHCLFPTKNCEHTQFRLDRKHHHAGKNRGFFNECKDGSVKIIDTFWDKPGVLFENLLEFKAIENHYRGIQSWRDSEYANRWKEYIKSGIVFKNFDKNDDRWKTSEFQVFLAKSIENNKNINKDFFLKKILIKREHQITNLIYSIKKSGIIAKKNKNSLSKLEFIDNISINIGKKLKFYFNNRGHHRLSIAKIINLKLIPVKLTVVRNISLLKLFLKKQTVINDRI